jgi:iron(III) transport system substrate-binding protein
MNRLDHVLWRKLSWLIVIMSGLFTFACGESPDGPKVVVYTSVDQVYSEPILKAFEAKTGTRVLAVYDVEAAKTTGLANRLVAEKDRPRADVFWNGEFAQTLMLKEKGVLAPYRSPASTDLPALYSDPEGYWTAISGRARVLLINKNFVSQGDYPETLADLVAGKWPGEKMGIASPLFGTSATHAAALYAAWGSERARAFFEQLKTRGVRVVDGNSVVRDLVANGQLYLGLTDTDDACGALKNGAPVEIVFLDQDERGLGTLIILGTVAMIANAPHPREGQVLLDFLLSKEVEDKLIVSGWSQIPLRPANIASECGLSSGIKGMEINLSAILQQLEAARKELTEIFIR